MEFGRALTERSLAAVKTDVRYFGFATPDSFKDTVAFIRDAIYRSWDTSTEAPPNQRPHSGAAQSAPPDLQILAWQNGKPVFPEPLVRRFDEATPEFQDIKSWRQKFLQLFPASDDDSTRGPAVPGRVNGVCDFSLDGDKQPLDFERDVELTMVPDGSFEEPRHGPYVPFFGGHLGFF